MTRPQVIEADLIWIDGRFQTNVQIHVAGDGRIQHVGKTNAPPTNLFKGHAILPGMVNAHSHAFQRGLRGLGESFPAGTGSFWTWREAMYQLVAALNADRFDDLCAQAFREMLQAGITTVGEFHYLHHETDEDFAFDQRILDVASRVGIRIRLLNAFYQTGGINKPVEESQNRFKTSSVESFWSNMETLQQTLDPETQSLGVVAHSIRAVPIDTICALHEEATRHGLPFHMHVEEQRKEIEDCQTEYGTTPLALLTRETGVRDNLAAVHCTHSVNEDIRAFIERGGRIVICPLTEANLGDGIPSADVFRSSDRVSLGTDSNARISMTEEMRWLEYGQRLSRETRGAITNAAGESAHQLFDIATLGGANALGLNTGTIKTGAYADFVALDLMHPSLRDASPDRLLASFVFGSDSDAIADVCVNGQWLGVRSD